MVYLAFLTSSSCRSDHLSQYQKGWSEALNYGHGRVHSIPSYRDFNRYLCKWSLRYQSGPTEPTGACYDSWCEWFYPQNVWGLSCKLKPLYGHFTTFQTLPRCTSTTYILSQNHVTGPILHCVWCWLLLKYLSVQRVDQFCKNLWGKKGL